MAPNRTWRSSPRAPARRAGSQRSTPTDGGRTGTDHPQGARALPGERGRGARGATPIVAAPGRVGEVRRLNRSHALVFLPSHRSYLDTLVLRPVLHRHGFPPNHVLGGSNLDFWPLGPVARRNGYVFIRR